MSAASSLTDRGVNPSSARDRPLDLAACASDTSHFLLTPQAAVVAEDETAVARVLAACTAEALPVTFRSGGTSLSGQAGTEGILLDVRRGFRGVKVLSVRLPAPRARGAAGPAESRSRRSLQGGVAFWRLRPVIAETYSTIIGDPPCRSRRVSLANAVPPSRGGDTRVARPGPMPVGAPRRRSRKVPESWLTHR